MYREIDIEKIFKNYHLLMAVFFVIALYITLLYLTLINPYSNAFTETIQILWISLQIFYIMMIWSKIRCIISDPGRVPVYWGVLLDDSISKKKVYCLKCHIFKPERCHHCNTCQRCVLNMDHHCPYLGNCIGYHNRKFFILFLFYINLSVLLSLSILSLKVYPIIMDLIYIDWKILIENYKIIPTFLLYLLVFVFQGIIFSFFKYHIDLISNNKNTQEILNSKRQNSNSPQISLDLYNVNIKENWFQVLGTNPWLWALPMFGESGRPKGNGLKWKFNNLELTMTEQIITHRTQTNQNQISDMIQQEQRV